MDDTPSELLIGDPLSDAGRLIHALGLAINDEPQIAEMVLAQNPQLWEPLERFKGLLDTAKQPSRDKIHTAVDNSIPNSMETDQTIQQFWSRSEPDRLLGGHRRIPTFASRFAQTACAVADGLADTH